MSEGLENGDAPALECSALRKTFGTLTAVQDVALTLRRGQILGLVGPNGAGKTTLMRMLATLLRPTSGEVRVLGLEAQTEALTIRRRIGYLPDFFNLYRDLTLDECLRFFAHSYRIPTEAIPQRIQDALAATGLLEKRHEFVRHLSRGMVQRLGMAMLMVRDAEIMILDEPASGLDPNARVQLRQILKAQGRDGKAILISSHILNELEDACTHLAIMDRGRIVAQGTMDEIRRRVFAGRRYRIRVMGNPEAARQAAVEAGLSNGRVAQGYLIVDVPDEAGVAQLNARLVSRGISVTELREISDLEDAFIQIISGGDAGHEVH